MHSLSWNLETDQTGDERPQESLIVIILCSKESNVGATVHVCTQILMWFAYFQTGYALLKL